LDGFAGMSDAEKMLVLSGLTMAWVLAGCSTLQPAAEREWIAVGGDGKGFVCQRWQTTEKAMIFQDGEKPSA
jgi:hypothetical protein